MNQSKIDVPKSWMGIDKASLQGTIMVIGESNSGKTTFCQYLYRELQKMGQPVAYLDGDPGQSSYGPPTTMSLKYISKKDQGTDRYNIKRSFVGSISPRGNMLQVLVSARRLVDFAKSIEASTLIYDTTGLIDPEQGGLALKLAKIDLLRPSTLIALQREHELNPVVLPFNKSNWINVNTIKPSENVILRDKYQRQVYRARKFREYFFSSIEADLKWENYSIFPMPSFAINRLLAFVSDQGFVRALGIIISVNWVEKHLTVKVPNVSLRGIQTIHLGNILVNPDTFEDRLL